MTKDTRNWDSDVPPVTDDEMAGTLELLGGKDPLDVACLDGTGYEGACALHRQPSNGLNIAATDRAKLLGISEDEAWGIMSGWDFGADAIGYHPRAGRNEELFDRGILRGRRLAELVARGIVYVAEPQS